MSPIPMSPIEAYRSHLVALDALLVSALNIADTIGEFALGARIEHARECVVERLATLHGGDHRGAGRA